MSSSATGGYLLPTPPKPPTFGDLSFEQFIQTAFVGVSGLPGDLVRPRWQLNPPKQPDATVNWMSFGLTEDNSDTNAVVGVDSNGNNTFQRQEDLPFECWFYGPDSYELCKAMRDGFQITQNMQALMSVQMAFAYTNRMVRSPDLVNERWVDRWIMTVMLRRQVNRTYPILTFVSGSGVLHVNNSNGEKNVAITVEG